MSGCISMHNRGRCVRKYTCMFSFPNTQSLHCHLIQIMDHLHSTFSLVLSTWRCWLTCRMFCFRIPEFAALYFRSYFFCSQMYEHSYLLVNCFLSFQSCQQFKFRMNCIFQLLFATSKNLDALQINFIFYLALCTYWCRAISYSHDKGFQWMLFVILKECLWTWAALHLLILSFLVSWQISKESVSNWMMADWNLAKERLSPNLHLLVPNKVIL